MVIGTSQGFQKDLQLIGVGYRGTVAGNKLTMNLGFSHPVEMEIPSDVEVKVSLSCLVSDVITSVIYMSLPQMHLLGIAICFKCCSTFKLFIMPVFLVFPVCCKHVLEL